MSIWGPDWANTCWPWGLHFEYSKVKSYYKLESFLGKPFMQLADVYFSDIFLHALKWFSHIQPIKMEHIRTSTSSYWPRLSGRFGPSSWCIFSPAVSGTPGVFGAPAAYSAPPDVAVRLTPGARWLEKGVALCGTASVFQWWFSCDFQRISIEMWMCKMQI